MHSWSRCCSRGCVQQQPSPTASGGQLARACELHRSAAERARLADWRRSTVKQATFNLVARDEQGNVVAKDIDVEIFISFGGVKTGANSACGADETGNAPIETVTLKGGRLMNHSVHAAAGLRLDLDLDRRAVVGRHRRVADDLLPQRVHQRGADAARSDGGECHLLLAVQRQVPHLRSRRPAPGSWWSRRCSATPSPSPTPAWRRAASTASTSSPSASRRRYIVEGRVITSFSRQLLQVRRLHRAELPALRRRRRHGAAGAAAAAGAICAFADIGNVDKHARRLGRRGALHGHHLQSAAAQSDQRSQYPEDDRQLEQVQPVRRRQRRHLRRVRQLRRRAAGQAARHASIRCRTSARAPPSSACCATTRGRTRTSTATATPSPARTRCRAPRASCISGTCYKNAFNFWTIDPRRQEDVTVAAVNNRKTDFNSDRGLHAPDSDLVVYVRLALRRTVGVGRATTSTPA